MEKKLIKEEYFLKIKLFQKYNKSYYDKSISLVADSEFDILKNKILELVNKTSFRKL